MKPDVRSRREAHGFGRRAEALALLLLAAKGYRILARRYLAAGGEVDLIVARGAVIAFVEVKARPDLPTAELAITAEKARRVSSAARVWLSRRRLGGGFVLRGDAVYVAPWKSPKHVADAFVLELGGD